VTRVALRAVDAVSRLDEVFRRGLEDVGHVGLRIAIHEREPAALDLHHHPVAALEGVQQEALVGSRTVLDVLDAEQELLDAQVNLVRAERDEIVAQYALLSAVGRLTAQALKLDTAFYDAQKYYRQVQDKWWGLGDDVGSEGSGSSVRK